jgi:hypothetical protein
VILPPVADPSATMPSSYRRLITSYCTENGIAIPPGFGRNTPSRYAIIRTDASPPKLVAMTWFKQEDVHYYIDRFLKPELGETFMQSTRILDFKEGCELVDDGSTRFKKGSSFTQEGPPS